MDTKDEEKSIKPHDKYFKKMLPEFLKDENAIKSFFPADLIPRIDFASLKVESDSYIETNLSARYSDVVCSFKTSDNKDDVFLYLLVEHQSTSDWWISLRLNKYKILLYEKHKDKKKKLPIVVQGVVYNGNTPYNAPRSFWDLFTDPVRSKETFVEDYKFLDLYATSDEELNNRYKKSQNTAGWLFLMKHKKIRILFKRSLLSFCKIM